MIADAELQRLEASLSDEDKQFLDRLAEGIADRRMLAPAIFVLESMKPLAFVGGQAMHFFRPIVQTLWSSPLAYDRVCRLLEKRGAVELLLRRLEAHH